MDCRDYNMNNSHLDDELETAISNQANEILELKAHITILRKALDKYLDFACDSTEDYEAARDQFCDALTETPEQSLAAHDLGMRDKALDDAMAAMNPMRLDIISRGQAVEAIRNLKSGGDSD